MCNFFATFGLLCTSKHLAGEIDLSEIHISSVGIQHDFVKFTLSVVTFDFGDFQVAM